MSGQVMQGPAVPVLAASRSKLATVVGSSLVGTVIEFYDFFIYGTAAALVFPRVFFPTLSPAAGLIAAYATLAIPFITRPMGAVVFGHFGDRVGRKSMLVLATYEVMRIVAWCSLAAAFAGPG